MRLYGVPAQFMVALRIPYDMPPRKFGTLPGHRREPDYIVNTNKFVPLRSSTFTRGDDNSSP